MSVTPEYRDWVLEQLRQVGGVSHRAMFGGVGLYSDGLFFALIADDVLYLKVDDTTRPRFEAAGMEPFRPYDDERTMAYFTVPVDALEDPDRLREWAGLALDAASRARKR